MLQAFVFVTNRFEYYMERGVFCQAEWGPALLRRFYLRDAAL